MANRTSPPRFDGVTRSGFGDRPEHALGGRRRLHGHLRRHRRRRPPHDGPCPTTDRLHRGFDIGVKRAFQPFLRKRVADTDNDAVTRRPIGPGGPGGFPVNSDVDGHGIAKPNRITLVPESFPKSLSHPSHQQPAVALLPASRRRGWCAARLIATVRRNDHRFCHGYSVHHALATAC